ncbi:hypothetical protein [Lacibacter sp. H407]|uniref:hypothetical protein n=1 Tax=Lacibacter sp. H407 TaxID=3133423 RepID=UPI0030C1A0AD
MKPNLYLKSIRLIILLLSLIAIPFISFGQAANNTCGSSVLLTSGIACSTTIGDLQDATKDGPNSGAGCSHTTTNDVWYRFSAQSSTTTITISGLGSNLSGANTFVEILSGSCGSFTSISCQSVSTSLVVSGLSVSTTYYVRVYTTSTTTGNPSNRRGFSICITHPAPPPANDNCASATSLTSNTSCSNIAGTVIGGTSSGIAVPSCGGTADDDVWYSFTAVQSITTISLSGIETNLAASGTVVELFSGTCGSLTSLGCNFGTSSALSLSSSLTIGATYYIRVYSMGNTALTSTGGYNICITHVSPPANDNCAGAINLIPGVSCINTAGTVVGATNSGITAPSCGGVSDDDVWYMFTATVAPTTTITLSGLGTNLSGSGAYMELFSGTCGSLTSLFCSTSGSISMSLTNGAVYYVRVYSAGSSAITSNGTFNICITTPAATVPANVSTGKSFINITRPNGGTIIPGDVLEIRVSVNVANNGSNRIFRARYNDTIPSNLTYVAGSLKLLTNEGKQYAAYTDASGDDFGMYDGSNRTVRFNLGRDTTNMPTSSVNSTGIDSATGGYYNSGTHRPRGNGVLVIVTYRVTVDASIAYNTIVNYGSGAVRYRNQLSSVGAVDYTNNPNSLSFIIYPNYGLCSNATGANNVNAGSGDFGSGTSLNGANPGTVSGYNFVALAASNPQDGNFSVTKNLSPNQLTDPTVARPNTTSGNRIFGVWDIIGDHTGAADPLAGNPAPANGVSGGYMLAVNAAYQLSIANNQNITGLCEDTYYEFSAWFRNVCKRCGSDSTGTGASGVTVNASYIPTAPGDSSGVKPNLTFQINGIDYYNTGTMDYIGTWGQWVKKGFVFKTGVGQTALTISIKNNAPGGGGNDWVMDDISFATCLPTLTMRPTNSPTYCDNNQVDISVAVSTFFDNYNYYQWERSTDNGTTWISAPESPSVQSFGFTNYSGEYRDTAALPSFIASSTYNGYKYRIRVGTSTTNLSSGSCALYNDVDIITINVQPSCAVLPVEILQFNVQLKNEFAVLHWKAKQEANLIGYTVERSTDGRNFTSVGMLTAKGAQSNEEQYFFNDTKLVYGKVYYRLRLSAVQGGTKFSNVLTVQPGQAKLFDVSNLVNPIASKLSFQVIVAEKEQIDVQLLDATGRFILTKKLAVSKGTNAMMLDVPDNLQPGSYIVRIVSRHGIVNKPVQKR